MEYQVPQFIDVEDKIFGPFTLRQFIYLAGGAGLCVIIFFTLPFFVAVLLALPVIAFTAALAFYRINNKPFIEIVEAAATFFVSFGDPRPSGDGRRPAGSSCHGRNDRPRCLARAPRQCLADSWTLRAFGGRRVLAQRLVADSLSPVYLDRFGQRTLLKRNSHGWDR